jgi:hypothetical protein
MTKFTIRNRAGQYLGTYAAKTAAAAIARFLDEQNAQFATFRGTNFGHRMITAADVTATGKEG